MLDQAAIRTEMAPGTYCQSLTSGHFFVFLFLTGPDDEVGLEFGRNVLAKIEEVVTQTPSILPAEIVEMQKDEFENGAKVHIGVGKIINQILTLAVYGQIQGKIIRKNKVINLFAKKNGGEYRVGFRSVTTGRFNYPRDG